MADRDSYLKFFVNLFTASGAGLSTVSILYAFNGSIRDAWILMGIAMLIDWVDGSLVRYWELESSLTEYDGEKLDSFADYVTYVIAPLAAAWASGVLSDGIPGMVTGVFVCVVSSLQFARTTSKTERAFEGWPSYWNFLYFYGWGLGMAQLDPAWMISMSWLFGLATFVSVPFPYPSRFPVQRIILTGLGTLWGVIVTGFLMIPEFPRIYLALSLLFPLYYLALPLIYYDTLEGPPSRGS